MDAVGAVSSVGAAPAASDIVYIIMLKKAMQTEKQIAGKLIEGMSPAQNPQPHLGRYIDALA